MTIAVDQANLGTLVQSTGATSIAVTTSAAVAVGGFIVVGIMSFVGGISVTTVTGGGLTWSVDKQGHAGSPAGPNPAIISAQAPAGLASSTTITVNFSVSSNVSCMGVSSFTGVLSSAALGVVSGPTGVAPAAAGWTTPSMNVQAGSLVVGCCNQETANTTSTPTSPSVEVYDVTHANGFGLTAAYRIEAAANAAATVAGTFGANCQSTTVGVEYLAAAGGGIIPTFNPIPFMGGH